MKTEIPVPLPWAEPLADYLSWLRSARRSNGTIKLHSYRLRRFATRTALDPWQVTLDDLVRYLDERADLGGSSLRGIRQVLRGFYRWACLSGRRADDPSLALLPIKSPIGVPRPAPEHAVRVGRRNADERTRLMLELAVNAGLRCCEICRVHTRDLEPDIVGWSLIVYGKGGRQRRVPLTDDLAARLRAREPGWAFPGKIDGHLSPARVSELVSGILPPGVTAHMLRHRFGTRAYQQGGHDIRAVQDLLGHAYVSTTQIYTAVDDGARRRAALAAAS